MTCMRALFGASAAAVAVFFFCLIFFQVTECLFSPFFGGVRAKASRAFSPSLIEFY